jgi:acyl carrier protein
MTQHLEQKVRQLVADVFGLPLEAISAESSQKSISNWDSLNIINIMIAIESEFNVTLEVDEAVTLISVRAIMDILRIKGIT